MHGYILKSFHKDKRILDDNFIDNEREGYFN